MQSIKTAVIGVGYLGRFHAQKYKQLEGSELIGVVDTDESRARAVGEELGVPGFTDLCQIIDQVQAVSVVVPTEAHFQVAEPLLKRGVHVLLEKPFAKTLEEAETLKNLAQQHNLVLQIGHLERFNVVYTEHRSMITRPQFIEGLRIAPFPKRATDVDVILDLMIHDIDLVLSLTGELPCDMQCTGVPIITRLVDLANARLTFPSGCVANLTASRVSDHAERKLRVFQPGLYLSLDFGTGEARKLVIDPDSEVKPEDLKPQAQQLPKADAILLEIQEFLQSVRQGNPPKVSANDGLDALRVAMTLLDSMGKPTS